MDELGHFPATVGTITQRSAYDICKSYYFFHKGNSDYSYLSAVISMALSVPNLCVSMKVFLKHQVNFNTVCDAMQDLLW